MPATIHEASPADSPALGHVHVSSWRTSYRGIVPQETLDNLSVEERERRWQERLTNLSPAECVFVAEDETRRIIGFASGGPTRDGPPLCDGELYAIYLLQEAQRQGIGRQLVEAVARRLRGNGCKSMLVRVLAANPACRFYEALGGSRVAEKQITIGGSPLDSVGYAWSNISELIGNR